MTETLDCGHEPTPQPAGSITNGIARDSEGKTYCFACSDESERQRIADPTVTRFVAYVSEDGKHITTWPGGELANIISGHEINVHSWIAGRLYAYRARTPDGREWYGRSARGMVITLRACKAKVA